MLSTYFIVIIIDQVHAHENVLTRISNRTITSSGVNSIQLLSSENFIGFRPQSRYSGPCSTNNNLLLLNTNLLLLSID